MNSNALPIKSAVVTHAILKLRHIMVTVEPSFQAHDVWTMSMARKEYEWEIKQSMSDLRREIQKPKHKIPRDYWFGAPNHFYVVVPESIEVPARKYVEEKIPYAGFAVVRTRGLDIKYTELDIVKRAPSLHSRKADLLRCARVSRWMAVTLEDLMRSHAKKS